MTAAMTAMDSDIMIVWLTPRRSSLRASGIRAVSRRWRAVEPSDATASSTSLSAPRSPSEVRRAIGGAA